MSKRPQTSAARRPASPSVQKIVQAGGGPSAMALKIGITPEAILQWTRVPIERAVVVARATGIPVKLIRPDFWGDKALSAALNAHLEQQEKLNPICKGTT